MDNWDNDQPGSFFDNLRRARSAALRGRTEGAKLLGQLLDPIVSLAENVAWEEKRICATSRQAFEHELRHLEIAMANIREFCRRNKE